MSTSTEQARYARAASSLARSLAGGRPRGGDDDDLSVYERLAEQLSRSLASATVAAAARRQQAVADKGEGFVVAGGRWSSLERELIAVLNEGVIELKGEPPAVGELPDRQGYFEMFKFGPFVAFSVPPEEITDPDTGAVAWSITVNKDRNWRTVRLAMPRLSAVPGASGRYTLDGRSSIDATIIESATEVNQAVEKVDFP